MIPSRKKRANPQRSPVGKPPHRMETLVIGLPGNFAPDSGRHTVSLSTRSPLSTTPRAISSPAINAQADHGSTGSVHSVSRVPPKDRTPPLNSAPACSASHRFLVFQSFTGTLLYPGVRVIRLLLHRPLNLCVINSLSEIRKWNKSLRLRRCQASRLSQMYFIHVA